MSVSNSFSGGLSASALSGASLASGATGQAGFALDMQGLQRLKSSARNHEGAAAEEAARQFEALFIDMMMKSMREATPSAGLTDSRETQFYQSLLDKQWSQTMASRGIGLADQLLEQLGAPKASTRAEHIEQLIAGIPRGTPRPLDNALRTDVSSDDDVAMPDSFLDELGAISEDLDPQQASARIAGSGAGEAPQHVREFVARLSEPAEAASRTSGVPAELILAQAALETGWGRREIATANGGNSYNLFGIKAGSSWQGPTTRITTHEVADGQRYRIQDDFRVYGSFEEAFTDYARLISDNPRYASVATADSPSAAAQALQRGGYATDPAYAAKLIAVMNTMGPLPGAVEDSATAVARQQSSTAVESELVARVDTVDPTAIF
ncbi:flagellar assembly peptidoglycan hydrolase FlgJ [Halomonas huangheensis]|uniref:Peptidoglycan hydrolase FlgJ n=1 Tax=Halomonas huangheensis TaxID=1178482 RepID=W1N5M0_9GAMM|nr:hypothetical protein BJB45_19580 [Halomonas huangheensis]